MKRKKWIAAIVMMILIAGNSFSILAKEAEVCEVNDSVRQTAVALLREGYDKYYDFLGDAAVLVEHNKEDGVVEEVFMLEITAMLRAERVEDLDYYQGMTAYYEDTVSEWTAVQQTAENVDLTQSDMASMDFAVCAMDSAIDSEYDMLAQYIGAEQTLRFFVKAVYDEASPQTAVLLFENGLDYVPAEQMYPLSEEQLQENGGCYMEQICERAATSGISLMANGYSVFNAVMYSETYTSNPTSCNLHGNDGSYVDTTKYNSNYAHYAADHSDCTNFASQILCAGGIPIDSEWKPGQTTWKSFSKLNTYMTRKGYWCPIPYSALRVGDFATFDNGQHVVFIAANDGVSFRFSAHTNDRKDVVLPIKDTNAYYRVNY